MAAKRALLLFLMAILCGNVQSVSLVERSYEYIMSLGKNLGPNLMSLMDCMTEENVWNCAKEKAGKILDSWDDEVQKQRRSWQDAADTEARSSGRSLEEMPSKIGKDVEESLFSIANMVQYGVARAMGRKHESGGIDSITISAGGDKKKMKKKKPPKIHLVHPVMMPAMSKEKGRGFGRIQSWVVGEAPASNLEPARFEQKEPISSQSFSRELLRADSDNLKYDSLSSSSEKQLNFMYSARNLDTDFDNAFDSVEHDDATGSSIDDVSLGRGMLSDAWALGEKALDAVAEHALKNEDAENGIEDKSSFAEQRGKKKKKKKAILKLLILGAVLKAKIGTLLQILSFKLQVKFFIIALIGLGINLARFWVDLKKKHDQPQKVIYYEHAQHQHHYDHEEDHGWGPWSRSMDPTEETEVELDVQNTPYRAYDRNSQVRPLLTRV